MRLLAALAAAPPRLARHWPRRDDAVARALGWLHRQECPGGGIRVHPRHHRPYPEVTGYLIPTLLQYGQRGLALRCARWLMATQASDGSFADPDEGRPQVFDTAQALRGLLALPEAGAAAQRAAAYVNAALNATAPAALVAAGVPAGILLYALPPLRDAAARFHCPDYIATVERICDKLMDSMNIAELTHFLGYQLDALLVLGRSAQAAPLLDRLRRAQTSNGGLRARAGVAWVCTPGLAQIAVCWRRCGHADAAARALAWLRRHQLRDGGFFGSEGRGAVYFPHTRPAWAVKFFLDAMCPN